MFAMDNHQKIYMSQFCKKVLAESMVSDDFRRNRS